MRRVSAAIEHESRHPTHSPLNGFDLLGRAIFILCTLNYQNRAADTIQIRFDIPLAKPRVEPDISPAPEQRICVCMIPAQATRQIRLLALASRLRDAWTRDLFNEYVRGFQNERSGRIGERSRIDNRNRCPVAVSEKHGPFDARLPKNLREHDLRLMVHVGDTPRVL